MSLKNMLSKLSPFYLPLNYVIKEICLYVILSKLSSFCLEEVLLYILKPI